MKSTPLMFTGAMIRAMLNRQKTRTSRVIRPQPKCDSIEWGCIGEQRFGWIWDDKIHRCPYGQAGDEIWVKETWRIGAWNTEERTMAIDYRESDFSRTEWLKVENEEIFDRLWEQSVADAREKLGALHRFRWKPGESPCRWRSAMFMPKWASRMTLTIKESWPERICDITPSGMIAEGIRPLSLFGYDYDGENRKKDEFVALWDSINKKRGFGWDRNPLVWAIDFSDGICVKGE